MLRLLAGIAISGAASFTIAGLGWELVAQLYSGCGRKVVSNSGVVPSEGTESSGSLPEQMRFEISVSPCTGRGESAQPIAISREDESLIRDPSQPFRDLPSGSTPAETFVRVGPRVRIRSPPAQSPCKPDALDQVAENFAERLRVTGRMI